MTLTLVAFVFVVMLRLARAVAGELPVTAGDWIELQRGKRARVRVVRCGYSVLDAADGSTLLVTNRTLEAARRPELARSRIVSGATGKQ